MPAVGWVPTCSPTRSAASRSPRRPSALRGAGAGEGRAGAGVLSGVCGVREFSGKRAERCGRQLGWWPRPLNGAKRGTSGRITCILRRLTSFFSCSFADVDKEVNEYFLAICRALDLVPINVSTGYTSTPPEVAKKKIESSQAVVAICTKRDELKAGGYVMPQAVHDEISFAYGKDTPVLMMKEEGVVLAGFGSNFGTYLPFEKDKLRDPDFLQKAIEAIHGLKLDVLGPHQIGIEAGLSEAHADWVHHLVELQRIEDDFVWKYSTSKKLIFSQPSRRGFPSQVWAVVPQDVSDQALPIGYELSTISSSRNIELQDTVEEHTSTCVKSLMRLSPHPEEGDFIEYSTIYSSKYLNPIWDDQVQPGHVIHLDSGDYKCADGLVFIHRTKSAIIEFRFPREYGLSKRDLKVFVGAYTSSVDYEVQSEVDRATIKVEEFAGTLVIRLEVTSPLPGHMYGIAWNPLKRLPKA